jgi:hypothetical protein
MDFPLPQLRTLFEVAQRMGYPAPDALHASFDKLIFRRSEKRMDVVRHDDCGVKLESVAVIASDSVEGNLRNFRSPEKRETVMRCRRQEICVAGLMLRIHPIEITSRR